jgi:citrate lyase beta subunit
MHSGFNTYLFIPGNRSDIIKNINNVKADYKIIDFEDSISSSEILIAYQNLKLIKNQFNILIRLTFFYESVLNTSLFEKIIDLGFKNFVLPKIEKVSQLIEIKKFMLIKKHELKHFNFILLIENPLALITIQDILNLSGLNIIGIALGSYDYCLSLNMEYNMKNIMWARNYLLNIAKAYNIQAIDIVSMEINNTTKIRKEILESLKFGFNGKLFIHPSQIKELSNIKLYTEKEVEEAYKVCSLIDMNKLDDFNVFKFQGKVYHKPLISRMLNIINWHKKYGKK